MSNVFSIENNGAKKSVIIDLLFIAGIYVIFLALSPTIYGDYNNYLQTYLKYYNGSVCEVESVYCYFFYYAVNIVKIDFEVAYRLYVLVGILLTLYCFYKSRITLFPFILYFSVCGLYIDFVLIRFGLSVSIVYLMIYYLSEKKIVNALIVGLMAVLFHLSAIFIVAFSLLLYAYDQVKSYDRYINLKITSVVSAVLIIVYFKYYHYFEVKSEQVSVKLILFTLSLLSLSLFSLWFKKIKSICMANLYEYFSVLSFFSLLVFYDNSLVASRLVYISSIGIPFIYNELMNSVGVLGKRFLKILAILTIPNLYYAKYWGFG